MVAGRGRFAVFISGEDGIDRDLIARQIHDASDWTTGGYFALDASIVPPSLVSREIFGSDEGAIAALPGAYEGAFERTAGGTVLIEHVDALPKELQQGLAGALERGTYQRIGGRDPRPFTCRLVASSVHTLDELTSSGRLAPGLAERLQLLEIRIPPLRQRREDVLPIAAHFLARARAEFEAEVGRPCEARSFSREAIERLVAHPWPGNERELREQIRSALRLARSEELAPEDLLLVTESPEEVPPFREAKRAFEREYVTRVLRLCGGNISRAARIARKDRKDFYDVMRRNTIKPTDFRS